MPKPHNVDRKIIFQYLVNMKIGKKRIVTDQEATQFSDAIERIIYFDKIFSNYVDDYAQETSRQHAFLNEILKSCNNLLATLQPLKRNKNPPKFCEDLSTANLIRNSLWHLNNENWIKRNAQPNATAGTNFSRPSDPIEEISEALKLLADINQPQHDESVSAELDTYPSPPEDFYPNAVIESIEKLRDAVACAAGKTKPKLGRKTYQTQEFIRKDKLGREFVQSYWMCFRDTPPISIDKPAYKVFVEFLHAANLSGEGEEHCYKKAIKDFKKYLKERECGDNPT